MRESEALFIDYGTTRIPFLLLYSKRKTLGITVMPDKQVIVTAPLDAGLEKIIQKLTNRAGWISRHIRKFDAYQKTLPVRTIEYVSGETFYYLGRKYRLKIIAGPQEEVKRSGKYLYVTVKKREDQKRIAALLMDWYKLEAKEVFNERLLRFEYILKREKIAVNQLMVRQLQRRWGSCTEKGNIVLNLSLIQAPIQCIDYVLVHEICHLKYLNHGAKFYELLSRYAEDWGRRRKRLQQVRTMTV